MSRRLAAIGLFVVAVGGCAVLPNRREPVRLLAEAERLTERGEYEEARRAYDVFLARYPADRDVPRAEARRETVSARVEVARLRHELGARNAEVARLRDELAKAREELAKVRADLEKVKEIDLKGRVR